MFALAVAACGGGLARAQVPPLPGPGPGGRPVVPLIENAAPRVTGNSFVKHWRPEELGGGSGNTAIVQHPGTGFLYVGNSQGVLEYDGARWQLIPLRHSGAVLGVAVDAQGRVWASSENELARLDADANGALHATTIVHPLPGGENGAIDQVIGGADAMWFRGLQHILRVDREGRVATWRTGERFGLMWWMDGAMHTKISDREVVRLEEGGGLRSVIDRNALRVPANRPSPFRVFAARQTAEDEWVLLTVLGPVRWRPSTRTWRSLGMRPPLFREAEALAATFLPDGAMVFITTRPGGFVIKADGSVERLLDRLPAVMNPRVTHITADREGGLWVTSRDHVARLQLRSAFARHEGAQAMAGNPRQLLRYRDGLFVAHTEGVSRHIDWPGLFPTAHGLHRGAEAIAVVNDRLYVAAAGLVELINDGMLARPWSSLAITTLTGVRSSPDLMLAGDAQGVWAFRERHDHWKPEGRLPNINGSITTLFDAGDGRIWGAMADGRIWRADFGERSSELGTPDRRETRKVDTRVSYYGAAQGVPATTRTGKVHFFALGEKTFATCADWLLRYDAAADRFVPEPRFAPIAARGAEAIGPTADGGCWLRLATPDRRIIKVTPDGDRWRTQELVAPMIRDLAAVSLFEDHGSLWVAGKDLLVSIDLHWRDATPLPPLVARLRRVTAEGEPITLGQVSSVNEQPGPVRFEFCAPSFLADHRGRSIVRYRTQLVGLEKDWSAWTEEAWRDFTKLPAGNYQFRLQASDQTGRVSAETSVAFVLAAPWWRTGWAATGYAAALAGAVFGVVRLRTRALQRRAARLEATVAARTDELQRSNRELARLHRLELDEKAAARLAEEEARLEVLRYQLNPHFLYNALNSIYSLVLTAPPSAANMVLRLADFCRVALDRRHEEQTTIGAEFDKLSIYLEIEKARWGESLHIAVEADEAARRAALPPFLLLPLVENAMKYGSATSPEDLQVRVAARIEEPNTLVLTVANSGEWVQRTGSTPPFSGIGLTNLRQRLQRYHPDAHEIAIETEGGWVKVTLRLRIPETGNRIPESLGSRVELHS